MIGTKPYRWLMRLAYLLRVLVLNVVGVSRCLKDTMTGKNQQERLAWALCVLATVSHTTRNHLGWNNSWVGVHTLTVRKNLGNTCDKGQANRPALFY